MAGADCLSAAVGAAANENQEPYSRPAAAGRTASAATSQRLDPRRIGGPGGDGQTVGRSIAGCVVARRTGSRVGPIQSSSGAIDGSGGEVGCPGGGESQRAFVADG